MAYFAKLDESNIVVDVTIADDLNWVTEHLEGKWIETALDGSIRYNYAGIGYTYDPTDDAFIEQKPYPSWVLNENKQWIAPIAKPADNWRWAWDEEAGAWIETNFF
jgi:hypothetical protein